MGIFYGVQNGLAFSLNQGCVFSNAGNGGGYPGYTAYTLHAHNTDILQRWAERADYPMGDHPDNPEVETNLKADLERFNYGTYYPRSFSNGDLIYMKYNGGPGYGDPLERPIELCEKDLNDGIYTERTMAAVYGVVANKDQDGRYVVDSAASQARRAQIRSERANRSVDFATFYRRERTRLLAADLSPVVRNLYVDLSRVGPRWWQDFKQLWQLPSDFDLKEVRRA